MTYRREKDALGEVQVPKDVYYGSFTKRALDNFNLSTQRASDYFRKAIGSVKKSACLANTEMGLISKENSKAILTALDEFIEGRFSNEYNLDIFQAGAGTPFNMNCNEIVANRANELLGAEKGTYKYVHPNNHVNMGQSSNDTIPTAIRIANLWYFERELKPALMQLINSLRSKAKDGAGVLKVGRTHMQDAVPMTFEQEFNAMARMLEKSLDFAAYCSKSMHELGLGGTAIGSGITTPPEYKDLVVKHLREVTGLEDLYISEDTIEMTQSCDALGIFSSGLRAIANDWIKICGDLKILNMGPLTGVSEIELPEVEPGSSIMPGKVNPSVVEAVHMVACQVVGNDHAIQLGVQSGQLQLNVMTPMILFNLEFSQTLLKNTADMFRVDCIDGLIIKKERTKELLEGSLAFATALVPYLGYQVVAELVNEGLDEGKTIKDMVLKYDLMTASQLDRVLDPSTVTEPAVIDTELRDQICISENYINYRSKIGK
jgi:aspartate ammonia-lyase